jgi:hypothetical protein
VKCGDILEEMHCVINDDTLPKCIWFDGECVSNITCDGRTPREIVSSETLSCGPGCVKVENENEICKESCYDNEKYEVDKNGICVYIDIRKSKESKSFPWWIIIVVASVVLMIIILIILLVLYKKKKKKKEEIVDEIPTNQNLEKTSSIEVDISKPDLQEDLNEKDMKIEERAEKQKDNADQQEKFFFFFFLLG